MEVEEKEQEEEEEEEEKSGEQRGAVLLSDAEQRCTQHV